MTERANLFLVGAMKAGTTAFADMIEQHSNIYMSPIKEPHFFVNALPKSIYEPSRFFNLKKYFENEFPKPLHIAKLQTVEDYAKLFSLCESEHAYRMEASTGYLHAPEASGSIYEYNHQAKIIILLREPLARAFSHYKMDVALGRTTMSFQEELMADIEAYQSGTLSNWSYLGMSLYFENVKRFIDCFGEEQVHILTLAQFKEHHETSQEALFSFLKIQRGSLSLVSKNTGKELRLPILFYLLKKWGVKDYFSYIVPKKLRQQIFKKMSSEKKTEIDLNSELLDKVTLLFNKDQQKLKAFYDFV